MRRTTLGPIGGRMNSAAQYGSSRASLGGMKSRASMGAGGAGRVPPKGKATPRRSMAPGHAGGGRKSSVRTMGRAADPRPLSNKAFQNQSIRGLIKYLTEHHYHEAISPKILTHPSKKDFVNIVNFLFSQLDSKFAFSSNVDNDIAQTFKGLRYPFGISKTGLVAVGSPHTWPALLGSLTWLIDLLNYDKLARDADEEEGYGDEGGKMFFNYLSNAYETFMSGDDEMFEKLDAELKEDFSSKNDAIKSDIAAVEEEMAALKSKQAELTSVESSLPGLRAKKADYVSDHEKFAKLIGELEAHRDKLEQKQGQRNDELAAEEATLTEAKAEVARLQHRVDTQELSATDAQRMATERSELRAGLLTVADERDSAQEAITELSAEKTKLLEELNSKIREYGEKSAQLQLRKRISGADLDVQLSDGGSSVLTNDLESSLKPALRELKAEIVKQQHATRAKLLEASDNVAEVDEQIQDRVAVIQSKVAARDKLDAKLRSERESLDAHLASSREEMEAVEAEIDALQNAEKIEDGKSRDLSAAALDALEAEVEADIVANDTARRELYNQIVTAMDDLTKHKEFVQTRLDSLQSKLESRLTTVRIEDPPEAPVVPM